MIKILERYIARELLRSIILTVIVLCFLMTLGMAIQALYIGVDVVSLRDLIPYMVLTCLPYALPCSILTAAAMTFGRLAGDNEITAMAACGIHLSLVVFPSILIGILFGFVSLTLTAYVLPKANFRLSQLHMKAVKRVLRARLNQGEAESYTFHPYSIHIGRVENGVKKDIVVFKYSGAYTTEVILAREGDIDIDTDTNMATLRLRGVRFDKLAYSKPSKVDSGTIGEFEISLPIGFNPSQIPRRDKDKTLNDLWEQKRRLQAKMAKSARRYANPHHVFKSAVREQRLADRKQNDLRRALAAALSKKTEAHGRVQSAREALKQIGRELALMKEKRAQLIGQIRQIDKELKDREALDANDVRALGRDRAATAQRLDQTEKERAETQAKLAAAQKAYQQAKIEQALADTQYEKANQQFQEISVRLAKYAQTMEEARAQRDEHDTEVEIHDRIAMAFSCVTFVLLAGPLGLMARRGNILVGLGIAAAVILLLYYPLLLAGHMLTQELYLPVIPCVWLPNVVVGTLGTCLIVWRFRS